MKENSKLIAVSLLFLILGILSGYFVSGLMNQAGELCVSSGDENQKNIDDKVVNSTVSFIQNNLVRSGIDVDVINTTIVEGTFYRLELVFKNKGEVIGKDVVLTTSDGKIVYLREIDTTKFGGKSESSQKNELKGLVRDDRPWVGSENAKVTIVLFSDFACPYCAKLETEVVPKLLENYSGEIKIIFRDFPIHQEISLLTSNAAYCAGEQGKYLEYRELLFRNQSEWLKPETLKNDSILVSYAEDLGLDTGAFKTCLSSNKYLSQINEDFNYGRSIGIKGTPTMFINEKMVVGYRSYDEISKIIEEELKK